MFKLLFDRTDNDKLFTMKRLYRYVPLLIASASGSLLAEKEVPATQPAEQIPYYSVEESLSMFELPDGYRLEPVVTDPVLMHPVLCVFDGNGRMFVAEMRTYMLDADGTDEQEPISRVSLHEDTDGDGKMDKHTVFADNLLLPRTVLPLDDRVLIQETNTLDVYSYRDTDGDGVADEKEPFYIGGPRGGNMEHQPSGLIWSLDNHIYTTYNSFRMRYNPDGLATTEPTAPNQGQWGLAQDDEGKPWFVNGGGEIGPLNFQQPIVYGRFNANDQYPADYREVFPLVGLADVQGGEKRFRPDDLTLNHFTSTCGQEIFRGDKLPADLRGDLLFAEPVGRLIRRSSVTVTDGITRLANTHPKSEFIRSRDPNFRPVNMANGPDGCLYIVDMYHGIVQQANWTQKGSYLREKIDEFGFANNVGKGRIYRLVHEDYEPAKPPRMLEQTPADWVKHLESDNGWVRDTAQKLLVLKGDNSVTPALEAVLASSEKPLARLHALWTLEGLGSLSQSHADQAFADSDVRVRKGALRAAETLVKGGSKASEAFILAAIEDENVDVRVQAFLSQKLLTLPGWMDKAREWAGSSDLPVYTMIGEQSLSGGGRPKKLTQEQIEQFKHGETIYSSLCFSCHGADGKGTKLGDGSLLAPGFAKTETITGHDSLAINVVLHGLRGPINGITYPGEMIAMQSNGDKWIADVLSYIRNSFGNSEGFISEAQVTEVREKFAHRSTPWTYEELVASAPRHLSNRDQWKITSSHGGKHVTKLNDRDPNTRFTTNRSMKPGMWVKVALPEKEVISDLCLNYGQSPNDYPRGCDVEFSVDGERWETVASVDEEKATRSEMTISLDKPKEARYIRITQKGSAKSYWSIHELDLTTP